MSVAPDPNPLSPEPPPSTLPLIALHRFFQASPSLHSLFRFWSLVGTFFWQNRCQMRAAALAYTTLLALVPLLAVSISMLVVFKSDNAEAHINGWIENLVLHVAPTLGLSEKEDSNSARQAVVTNIIGYISNIRFGTIGLTAMIGLIFAALSLIRTVEVAFNDIWGASNPRPLWNSLILYWSVLTLGPAVILLVTTSSYVQVTVDHVQWIHQIPFISLFNTAILPIATLTIAFGLFYLLMPNTKVEAKAALVGAAVAALLWWGNSQLSALYNTRVLAYSSIYGSIGAVPLFLFGLYFSWIILLFGAQVAYIYQNRLALFHDGQRDRLNQKGQEFAAVRLMTEIAYRFTKGEPPLGIADLSNLLGIPPKISASILATLCESQILHVTATPVPSFVPTRPIDLISIGSILGSLRIAHGQDLISSPDRHRSIVRDQLSSIYAAELDKSLSVSLAELIRPI